MVYLDYSATTPVNDEVLDTYVKVTKDYIGNSNSIHKLGVKSNELINSATSQIKAVLGLKNKEIIYTSGASESNNLALKGIAFKYKNRGNHIITTPLEHSSVSASLNYLALHGFIIDIVELDDNGQVDLESLKKLINDKTLIVTISAVDSELGILQNLDEIKKIISNYPKCFFHVDATQAIGKIKLDLNNIDLVSFSAHKFYAPKGIGCLIKNDNLIIDNLIHGGKSTSKFRSGTPVLPLIVSMSKALRLAYENYDQKLEKVYSLNRYLKDNLSTFKNVHINSSSKSLPHILNFSVLGIKPETLVHALEEFDIFISTKSACSSSNSMSTSVYKVTKNKDYALSSVRVSISYLTTKEEIDYFLQKFKICYDKLLLKGE